MRNTAPLITICVLLITAGCDRRPPRTADLVVSGVTVVDVARGALIPNRAIIIRGKSIIELADAEQLEATPGATVVDAVGKFAIPGLWDMHVHTGPKEVFLPLYVAHGITGIRDTGGDLQRATGNASAKLETLLEWREQIERGELIGPKIVATGPIIDGPIPHWPGVTTPVKSPEEARQLVRDLRRRGADFVKVYVELPADTYYAIADESKKHGLPFAGHVPRVLTVADATRAGQRCIEHLDGVLDCKAMPASDLFRLFVENDTWHVPTLALRRYLLSTDKRFLDDPRLQYIPVYIKRIWRKSWWHDERSPQQVTWGTLYFYRQLRVVKEMHDAGVGILAGSDSANPYTYPGFGLHDELERFVEAGLTTAETLRTATMKPAEFLGRTDRLGTIEAGKCADIVILDGDPLQDIRNTRKIHGLVLNGRYLTGDELQEMLRQAAVAARAMVD